MTEELTLQNNQEKYQNASRKQILISVVVVTAVLILGIVIGYFSRTTNTTAVTKACTSKQVDDEDRQSIHKSIVDLLNAENIRDNLRYFTRKSHPASSPRNNELIKEIHQRFTSYGFDAEFYKYDTLLTLPNLQKKNYVYIVDDKSNEYFKSKGIEDVLEPNENDKTAFPPFNAYGPNGTATSDLIYVNYGRYEDFEELENKYKVNCSGKVVIVRYGKIFRGDKVKNAEVRGAIGVLIYSDPIDYAPMSERLFPEGQWMPRDSVQRGSIITGVDGDPLTEDYPAKDWVYRMDISKLKLPKIPTQPISADDGYWLLKEMGGQDAGELWTGAFNFTYKIGPFVNTSRKVKVTVFNKNEIRTITNVCGTVKGKIEPDRYVLLGNHVDAWVFGAVDPSSGTSVMMEVARALGEKSRTGWQPRRTIKFCGWDGEEYNLIGSVEYVEEFRNQLKERAIAYINVDSAVVGNDSLASAASPVLHEMIFDVLKLVRDPYDDMTVFEKSATVFKSKNYPGKPSIHSLGAGTDYFAFYQFVGVPSIDMAYVPAIENRKFNISGYTMYHTLHDSFYWMENFVDREFKFHLTVARVAAYYVLKLSDTPLLPFKVKRYGEKMQRGILALEKALKEKGSETVGVKLENMASAVNNFSMAIDVFKSQVKNVSLNSELELRMINDRFVQIEKGFIFPAGLPGRPSVKHYIMAPALHNSYGSSMFPAIVDLLYDIKRTKNWDEVKKQISITACIIQAVAESLKSVT